MHIFFQNTSCRVMRNNNIPQEECPEEQTWLITYADLFTLLFAFFVLIAASGSIDQGKFDEIRESVSESLDSSDSNQVLKKIKEKRKSKQKLKEDIMKVVKEKNLDKLASFEDNKLGLKITFPSKILFPSASAELQPAFENVLQEIVGIMAMPGFEDFRITVEGHTDDLPIHTERFPSNWELSSARAASVVNYMTSHGFSKDNVKVAGYADSRPIKSVTDTMDKEEQKKARALNRRIELQIIYYKDQF